MNRDRAAIFLLGGVTAELLDMAGREAEPVRSIWLLICFLVCAISGAMLILE